MLDVVDERSRAQYYSGQIKPVAVTVDASKRVGGSPYSVSSIEIKNHNLFTTASFCRFPTLKSRCDTYTLYHPFPTTSVTSIQTQTQAHSRCPGDIGPT